MTPKALSREELEQENKYLREKIKWLEKEIFWNMVVMTLTVIFLAILNLLN